MNAERNGFHYYERRYKNLCKRFEAEKCLSNLNKNILRKYLDSLFADGLSLPRIVKCFAQTMRLVKWLGKDLDKVNKEDIVKLLSKIRQMDKVFGEGKFAESTFVDFKISLKRFFKWYKGNGEEYPPEVKWIKTTLKKKHQTLPEELLTEEEVKRIIDYSLHPRDRALFALAWETGARIGEIGNARIKSLSFKDGEAEIVLTGKTGSRKVLLISSVPYLKDWVEMHPKRDDPEAPLFVLVGTRNRGQPMNYAAMRKVFKVTMQRAGIKKKYNPHLWRHSRATYLAQYLTEAQLCKVMGWVIGSKEVRTYVSLSQRDTREAIRRVYGLGKKEKERESILTPKKCEICGEVNRPQDEYCKRCHNPLSTLTAVKDRAKLKQYEEGVEEVMPIIKEMLQQLEVLNERIKELEKERQAMRAMA